MYILSIDLKKFIMQVILIKEGLEETIHYIICNIIKLHVYVYAFRSGTHHHSANDKKEKRGRVSELHMASRINRRAERKG